MNIKTSVVNFGDRFYGIVRLADALDTDVVLSCEHAGTGARGKANGERERRGRPVNHAACHELQDDVAVVIDVALLDVVEETELPFVSFQKRMMLYSFSLVAVASRSAMAWRMKPMVSCEMLSFHNLLSFGNAQTSLAMLLLNRRFLGLYAECGDQRCQLFNVNHNQNRFGMLLRKATLIGWFG